MTLPPEQNWKGAAFYPEDSTLQRLVDKCLHATNWAALRQYAASLNNGVKCTVLPRITNGLNHLVCVLQFKNKARWVARIQMSRSTPQLAAKLQSEVATMALLAERTRVPVPRVFGYEVDADNPVGVAFMLMEYLSGDVAMDADGGYDAHQGEIPLHRRAQFYEATANAQVRLLFHPQYHWGHRTSATLTSLWYVGSHGVSTPAPDRHRRPPPRRRQL